MNLFWVISNMAWLLIPLSLFFFSTQWSLILLLFLNPSLVRMNLSIEIPIYEFVPRMGLNWPKWVIICQIQTLNSTFVIFALNSNHLNAAKTNAKRTNTNLSFCLLLFLSEKKNNEMKLKVFKYRVCHFTMRTFCS